MRVAEMKVEDIPIDKIHRHQNIRVDSLKDEKKVASLMYSIKQFGIFHPLHVMKDGKNLDTYSIIMGNRRLKACEKLGWKTIPSFVHYDILSYKEFLLWNAHENIERKNVDEVELGRTFNELMSSEVKMQPSEIAVRFSLPISRVKRAVNLYRNVPYKHRVNIRYMPEGGNLKRGHIPANVAQKVVNMTKKRGLGKYKDDLWDLASTDGFTGKDFNALALLLNRKFTVKEALKVLDDCKIVSTKIMVTKDSLVKVLNKYGLKQYEVVEKILSGQIKETLDVIDFNMIEKPVLN